jgi:hypothetical protein
MSTSTAPVSAPAAVAAPAAAPKISAGDAAIAVSKAPGAPASKVVKALWSIRGALKVQVQGSKALLPVVKAEIVRDLQALGDKPAPFYLVPLAAAGEFELRAVPPASKPSK